MRTFAKAIAVAAVSIAVPLAGIAPVWACAGLVTPTGNVKVVRTATLAAHHNGVEHYITSFTFQGGGAEFGAIVPLPAVPTKVERGGDWTLQRLEKETQGGAAGAAAFSTSDATASAPAEELSRTRIDALDVTVLKGGGKAVGDWARQRGFKLTADTPEVLDFYAARSPIFLAAVFDASAAKDRGQQIGEGTPVHVTMPLANPWVPLRILTVGQQAEEFVDADVYLLTDRRPALLPLARGLVINRDESARPTLLDDLRSDKGMEWMPKSMWFTHVAVGSASRDVRFDLASDVSGAARPSPVDAGLVAPSPPPPPTTTPSTTGLLAPSTTSPAPPPEDELVIAAPASTRRDTGDVILPLAAALLGLVTPSAVRLVRRRVAGRGAV